MDYRIELLNTLAPKQLQELFELFVQADFAEASSGSDWLAPAVENSLLAAGAFDKNNTLVGFARVLGDGFSDCYIQDVVVSADCRCQGIGRRLVELLLQELSRRDIDWVGLIATPGKEAFYRQLGFEIMQGYTPMLLQLPAGEKNSDKKSL